MLFEATGVDRKMLIVCPKDVMQLLDLALSAAPLLGTEGCVFPKRTDNTTELRMRGITSLP